MKLHNKIHYFEIERERKRERNYCYFLFSITIKLIAFNESINFLFVSNKLNHLIDIDLHNKMVIDFGMIFKCKHLYDL